MRTGLLHHEKIVPVFSEVGRFINQQKESAYIYKSG